MKKKLFMAGMFSMVLAFGIVAIGCDNGSTGGGDAFTGTWVGQNDGSTMKIVAASGSWKQYWSQNNIEVVRGTYSCSDNTVTATITEVNTVLYGGTDEWKNPADLNNIVYPTFTLSISRNTCTVVGAMGGGVAIYGITFTKQ